MNSTFGLKNMPDLDLRTTLLKDKLALLSAVGSIASIFGLGIVLVDKAVSATSLDPQSAAWRFIFFFIALFSGAGSSLIYISLGESRNQEARLQPPSESTCRNFSLCPWTLIDGGLYRWHFRCTVLETLAQGCCALIQDA